MAALPTLPYPLQPLSTSLLCFLRDQGPPALDTTSFCHCHQPGPRIGPGATLTRTGGEELLRAGGGCLLAPMWPPDGTCGSQRPSRSRQPALAPQCSSACSLLAFIWEAPLKGC